MALLQKVKRIYDKAGNVVAKECVDCGELKPIEDFRLYTGRSRDGHYGCCIICHRLADNLRYAARRNRK